MCRDIDEEDYDRMAEYLSGSVEIVAKLYDGPKDDLIRDLILRRPSIPALRFAMHWMINRRKFMIPEGDPLDQGGITASFSSDARSTTIIKRYIWKMSLCQ
jgi:hypothetical protein